VAGAFERELTAERPRTPDAAYGVPTEGGEMIDWSVCIDRLREAQAYWLATTRPDGSPHVVPVWGLLLDGDLYLEIGAPNTAKARNLAQNPSVAVHLDGADDALIVHGRSVECRPEVSLGASLAAAFAAKYKDYTPAPTDWDTGGLHRLVPGVMLAWRDMPTATRWRFPTDD
jgi:hypothetical protein